MSPIEYNTQVISYSKQLKGFALNLTADNNDAQDLLQETLIKAVIYREKFTENTNLKAWLYTIMKNLFINNYRRTLKTRGLIDKSKDINNLQVSQTSGAGITESIMREKDINKAIEKLHVDFQVPFQMYADGYKYKEIAECMNLPIGTIKSRIFLARKELMLKLHYFVN